MGIISGSLTFFRLRFNENLKFDDEEIRNALKTYEFDKLYEDEKFINYGFVPFTFPADSDFSISDIKFGSYFLFSIRIDEKKINKKYFDIEFEKMKRDYLKENNKTALTKSDRDFIKNALNAKLLKKALPASQIVEVLFSFEKKSIYLSALNTKVMDTSEHLFRLAFDISIYKDSFLKILRVSGLSKLADNVLKLTPYDF